VNFLQLFSSQPAHILWVLSGLMFLILCIPIGEPGIAALGFAAILTAIVSLTVPDFTVQLLIWGVLAISLALIMRGMMPNQSRELDPPAEAKVSESIPPGGLGEVAYEGSLWRARCQVSDIEIGVGQIVHVIDRQGNTLIVLPSTFLEDSQIVDRAV
jgi:membrane protein implicated in regulation of membrane protease activity